MYLGDRMNKLAGVAMLALVALVVVVIIVPTAVTGDADPTKRSEIEGILRDIHENEALFFSGIAADVASNVLLFAVVAPVAYLLFRDRSPLLAMVGFASFLAAGVIFLVGNAATISAAFMAADFVEEGGAGAIPAGDPAILQSARSMALVAAFIEPVGSTGVAVALLALGAVMAWAPRGELNPPRWFGGFAMLGGTAMLGGWIGAVSDDAGLALITAGYIVALVWFVLLGGWLIVQPDGRASATDATPLPSTV